MPAGVEYDESLSSPHMSDLYQCRITSRARREEVRSLQASEDKLYGPYHTSGTRGRRRLFNPTLGRDMLAPPCPSRLPKIKIQTRRLLSPSPLKDRCPPHCSSTSSPTSHSSSPVATNSHSSPWPTTRRYVPEDPQPRMCSLPHPAEHRRQLRPDGLVSCASCPRLVLTVVCSMSTPSIAPMPVPRPPTPCSALL